MADIITISDLSFSYEKTPVLSKVNLTVKEGEFIGIIGPNGGGKTTLLKLLMGFLDPQEGELKLFGHSPKLEANKIGYVPQALRYDKQFPISVLELVLAGLLSLTPWYGQFKQEHKKRALEALEKVGLADLRERPFSSLSGGQAQRALIARALVSNPKLLLLDEPTNSVDLSAAADIHQILRALKGSMTILMVTHDIASIIHQIDRVVCVQNELYILRPEEVCEHFALGLYHSPLITSLSSGNS